MNQENISTKDVAKTPCPNCGNQLRYAAEKAKLNCSYCNYSEPIDKCNSTVKDIALKEFMLETLQYIPEESGQHQYQCENCGSAFISDKELVNVNCGFCGSKFVNESAYEKKLVKPHGILPFNFSLDGATTIFYDWVKKGWLAPSNLKKSFYDYDLHGIYIPFWTYNADTETYYYGQRGRIVKRNSSWKINGVEVRNHKTKWTDVEGEILYSFKDILVVATDHIEQYIVEKILPFQMNEVQSFNTKYLSGWETDLYSIELEDGYDSANRIMDYKIDDMVRKDIGGDDQNIEDVQTLKYNQSFKHILLPVFICSYMYQNQKYHFTVNGQSGKIVGQRPYSKVKVIILLVLFAIIILTVVYFKTK